MAVGEGGDGRCGTEWRGPVHAIAQVTGVRGSDGRNSDAQVTVTPIDCLRVGAGTSLKGDVGGEREQESKERLVVRSQKKRTMTHQWTKLTGHGSGSGKGEVSR
jgi:hypothetical protein